MLNRTYEGLKLKKSCFFFSPSGILLDRIYEGLKPTAKGHGF